MGARNPGCAQSYLFRGARVATVRGRFLAPLKALPPAGAWEGAYFASFNRPM
jgi:hypothetical protein